MYPYFNNQPFLDSISSQTATINSLKRNQQYLTIALCVALAGGAVLFIRLQQSSSENNQLRRGFLLP